MKKNSLFILVILICSLHFSNSTVYANDNIPPVVNSGYTNITNATVGDTVTFYLDVSDPEGVDYIDAWVAIVHPDGYLHYIKSDRMTLQTNGYWAISVTVGQYFPDTTLYLSEIYVSDTHGNGIWRYNDYYYISYADTFSLAGVGIFGTTPDLNDGELWDIYFSQPVVTNGQYLTVNINAFDNQSGIDYIYFELWRNVSSAEPYYNGDVFFNGYYIQASDFPVGTTNFYFDIYVDGYWSSGDYFIPYLEVKDKAFNYRQYYNATGYVDTLNSPYVQVDIVKPIINNVSFNNYVVRPDGNQNLHMDIDLNGFTITTGWAYLAYNDPLTGDLYFLDSIYFDSTFVDPITGQFVLPVIGIFDYPLEVDIFVYDIEIYTETDYFYYSNINNFNSNTFRVSNTLPDGFYLSIDPAEGNNDIGQPVLFTAIMNNKQVIDISGNFTLEIFGTNSSWVVHEQYYYIPMYSEATYQYETSFNQSGSYQVIATFSTQNNGTFTFTSNWNVNNPDDNTQEYIDLNMYGEPPGGSEVNETVQFILEFTSTFRHDMFGLDVFIEMNGPTASHNDSLTIDLYRNSFISEEIFVKFTEAGTYKIKVTLTDDIGEIWMFETSWLVEDFSDDTTPPTSETEPTNNTGVPELQLPGFGFYMTIVGFVSMMILTYRRRNL